MPPKYHKTTETDFETFKKSVIFWMSYFGLKSYEPIFRHDDRHHGTLATLEAETGSRNAVFTLKVKWPFPATTSEIKKCAFHETCELLLHELREAIDARVPRRDTDDLVHTVIRQLENSVFVTIEANFDCESTK